MNAIEVSGLNTFYGKSHILHDVSLVAEEGSITTLLGRNGAGKTTMMRSIMGLTPARSGSIQVFGTEAAKLAPYQVSRLRVGYVPEGRRVFANLTVEDNLRLGGFRRRRVEREQSLDGVYAQFPRLKERHRQLAGTLSGG